ncbi:MAG: hypothetical protein F4013_06385 [Gammaproteobacteria bacterium]|nr:hypothetical protein [Gammaproteobacteria bacterium]MYH34417.1 hypothetical protein [Gammaproteobacteria bacterium]MYL01321.1 hypothetical protein [Gammaproteobacteria bacterium]
MKIYIDRRLGDAHDLISVSETLVCAQEYYPNAVDYRPDARLPVDFRRMNKVEINKFTASLDELSIEAALDFVAIFPCDLKSERALDFSPFLSLSPVAALDPSIDDANHPSITVDRVSGLRLGLHLDSWDGLEVSSRWKSRNRIVVNRGPADRYVYLVPVSIEEMAVSVASAERLHPGEVADAYIRNARQGPCLRMLQSANVAYVCCTERLVHDACVRAGGNRAESRHYLGHFVRN